MAIEDGWVLAEHVGSQTAARTAETSGVDWDAALAAYNAVRPEPCRGVVVTARAWGELWHLDGLAREQRNTVLRGRETRDYSFTDRIYGPSALVPEQEPGLHRPTPLDETAPRPMLVIGAADGPSAGRPDDAVRRQLLPVQC